MFEKSLEVLNSKVMGLQEQLSLQIKALETAKVDRESMAEKVYSLIHDIHNKYGVDGLNDVSNAIALFISQQQEVPAVAEVSAPVVVEPVAEAPALVVEPVEEVTAAAIVEPVVEVPAPAPAPAPVATEPVAEAPTPKAKSARKRTAIGKKEVPAVPSAPAPAPEPVIGSTDEDSLYYQPTIFGALAAQETEPSGVDAMTQPNENATPQAEEEVRPAPLNLEEPTWINFDQKAWLADREGTPVDELPCFFEEKITTLLREGWAYNEIPLTHAMLSDGTVISPENPDPCGRIAPAILLLTEDGIGIRKVFKYDWFSKVERDIIDKMFAIIYAEPAVPGWKKVLHIVERLTGLVNTPDETIEKAGILTPSGVIKMLSCGMVGTTTTDKDGNKITIKADGWKKYLIENTGLSSEEIAYLKENFGN